MIPGPLLRVTSRGGALRPRFVDAADPAERERAERILAVVEAAAARAARLGELFDELEELAVTDDDPVLWRGLAHLATAGVATEADPPLDPPALRAELFRAAAARGPLAFGGVPGDGPDADAFVAGWAAARGATPAQVRDSLYADLPSEAVVTSPRSLDPAGLLDRYNVALVQGVLRGAHELRIRLARPSPPPMRRLFRWLKFHQLLFRAARADDDLVLTVDGPVSLFGASTRYGRALAGFLPALLLHDEPWSLEARVEWTRRRVHRTLRLSREDGLRSHLPDTGGWRPKAIDQLARRLADGDVKGWTASDGELPVRVGREVWFPDFVVRDGARSALLVSLGHWRADRVREALQVLDAEGPANLVLLASRKSRVDRAKDGDPPEHARVVWYGDAVPVAGVRAAVEQFATAGEAGPW